MGTDVRIVVGPPARPGLAPPGAAADAVESFLREYDATLSRFRADSELASLNADPREVVPASPLLRSALLAALEAAELTGGLRQLLNGPNGNDGATALAAALKRAYGGSNEIGRALQLMLDSVVRVRGTNDARTAELRRSGTDVDKALSLIHISEPKRPY